MGMTIRAGFLTKIDLSPVDNRGRIWRVDSMLVYWSDALTRMIEVPAGFECDLNSMPRLAWIVSPKTDYPAAGVLHDWGYRGNLPRLEADRLYREVLSVLGMGKIQRNGRYLALRLFGRFAYKGENNVEKVW